MVGKASAEPIIKAFRIVGMHGYKDVELDFRGPARIAIAENGTGKTTILSALHSFLTRDFERLRNLSFESIECELSAKSGVLKLRREQLEESLDSPKLSVLARWSDLETGDLRRIILGAGSVDTRFVVENSVLNEIYQRSPYSAEDIASICNEVRSHWESSRSAELKSLANDVKSSIGGCDILYLPTYRRVELSMGTRRSERTLQRGSRGQRYSPGNTDKATRYFDIRFGLADVEDRLRHLAQEIQGQSNIGYRQISANIIDELLTQPGLPYESSSIAALPDIDALARFLSRIDSRVAPDQRLSAIRDLYVAGKVTQSDTMLRYFLSKLSRVVDQTKFLEANIEKFVEKANVYLVQSSDEKQLQYDATRMRVVVVNEWTKREVGLDDLSSGEKQVISLFAHMYLYTERKIVLIDEPELSLSIDWQRRLLPDVLNAPTCAQLLAITHSPFIFDNELDPYAGPIHITRRPAKA